MLRIGFIVSMGYRGFLELHRTSTAKFCVALEGSPFRFDGAEVGIEVFPTYARKFYAWSRRDCSVSLWRRGFLVRVVDDRRNGCKAP
jgi:hypothetical protein